MKFQNYRNNQNKDTGSEEMKTRGDDALVAKVELNYLKPEKKGIPIQSLQYVNILIQGKEIDAILDSGSQIPLLNSRYVPDLDKRNCGNVILTSAFGEEIDAKLYRIPVALNTNRDGNKILNPVEIVIAVTERLNVPCLLPPNIYESLVSAARNVLREPLTSSGADARERLGPFGDERLCLHVLFEGGSIDDSEVESAKTPAAEKQAKNKINKSELSEASKGDMVSKEIKGEGANEGGMENGVKEEMKEEMYDLEEVIDSAVEDKNGSEANKDEAVDEEQEETKEEITSPTPRRANKDDYEYFNEINLHHLDDRKKHELLDVLKKHADVFSGKIQIARVGEHKIRLTQGAERKKPYIYRIPELLQQKVDEQIEEPEKLDLIEASNAESAYPVVCVSKRDGSIRLCIDFRSLNVVTKSDDYPMENATELINQIGKATVITSLDILKGYWEIPLEEKSRDLTSFKTHRAQYRWKVMPFGLRNSAATFQRVMNAALSEHREYCRAYIDDIAIFSFDWQTHLKHLDLILTRLSDLKFTVNVKKCEFAHSQVKYLGHLIGSGRHQPDPEKLQAMEQLKSPDSKTQLRSLLGLCNHYKDYVKNYAIIWSLHKFETWIFGSPVELLTDHNPLTFITKGAPQSAKLQRWTLALQRYNISVSHCPGEKLKNADALSRLPADVKGTK